MTLTKQRFAAFTPANTEEYFTPEHRPKYISPVTEQGKYVLYNLRSPIESEQISHRGFALYDNPHSHGTNPVHRAYYVEDVGIVPASRLFPVNM